jgi:hypothetical protein
LTPSIGDNDVETPNPCNTSETASLASENRALNDVCLFVRTMFGLLFWDELFESGQLHSGFYWVPHCLKDRSFARLFATQIEIKPNAVKNGSALPIAMKTVASKFGRPNGVFGWDYVRGPQFVH